MSTNKQHFLLQAIADSKNVRSHTRDLALYQQVDELDGASTDADASDADDEETDDLRQESENRRQANWVSFVDLFSMY